MSSEFPCISMNLMSRERYSSGIQSPVSTCPPDWTYSRNSCVRASTMLGLPTERSLASSVMATRREELSREAARLFAERGFHGTSMDALAQALGVQKGSLYSLIGSKQELLYDDDARGSDARSTPRSTRSRSERPRSERVRLALRGHLRVVAEQLDVATVFTREWRYLEGDASRRDRGRAAPVRGALARPLPGGCRIRRPAHRPRRRAPRRCSCSRRRTGRTRGSSAGRDTDELADRFTAILVDGIRGYATPR